MKSTADTLGPERTTRCYSRRAPSALPSQTYRGRAEMSQDAGALEPGALEHAGVPEHVSCDPSLVDHLPDPTPGQRIGRYIIQRQLGRGGMGIVYGASDPELGRRVAIKLVRSSAHHALEQSTARLQREARALARLSHRNIVTIFDIGSDRLGTYVTMEYIAGRNLRRWQRDEDPSWRELVQVFVKAGTGLQAAHAAGVVHRDFKPTNVMFADDGAVKVLDFGLARGTPNSDPWITKVSEDLLAQRMTHADTIVGTTGYMPPEQLLGSDVGARSDQFAFCVTLFEALYGKRPYEGATPLALARSYAAKRRTTVKRRAEIPRFVRAAIERGMSLQPSDRFDDMGELLQALRPRRRKLGAPMQLLVLAGAVAATAAATAWFMGATHPTEPTRTAGVMAPR